MQFNPNDAIVKAVELSTAHLTKLDMQLLQSLAGQYGPTGLPPTVMAHLYGAVISIGPLTVDAIKAAGCSSQLGVIMDSCLNDGEVMYLAFDSLGPRVDGLEEFDW
jgi:hypothetical protein